MSERMIELQRAKLGLPPAGSPSVPIHNASNTSGQGSQMPQSGAAAQQQTPQEAAAAEVLSEDAQIQRFIHRLQRRDDSHPAADPATGPTVPTALSRRMLQRQGVGYLDDTVAAAISASADQFLATVLQQAVACRDQRLKGAEMTREAARHRKRHMQHYEADTDDRKRRKETVEETREKVLLSAIAAAEALKKGGGGSKDSDDKKSKKKKKKPDTPAPSANGVKPGALKSLDDDEESYDSIDEEEEYYQERLGEVDVLLKGDEDEDDDTLLLKDLVRPLEAWDFHLTGKEALETREPESDEDDVNEEFEENMEGASLHAEENGNEDGLSLAGFDGVKSDSKQRDDADNDVKRKSTASPVPNGS